MSSMGVSLVSGDEEHRRRSTQQLGLVSFVSEEEAEGYRRRRSTHAGLRELCVEEEEEEYFVSGEEEYTCWASSRAKRLVFRVWYSLGRG